MTLINKIRCSQGRVDKSLGTSWKGGCVSGLPYSFWFFLWPCSLPCTSLPPSACLLGLFSSTAVSVQPRFNTPSKKKVLLFSFKRYLFKTYTKPRLTKVDIPSQHRILIVCETGHTQVDKIVGTRPGQLCLQLLARPVEP